MNGHSLLRLRNDDAAGTKAATGSLILGRRPPFSGGNVSGARSRQVPKRAFSLSQTKPLLFSCSCYYSEDLAGLLLEKPEFTGRTVHTTSSLEPKIQALLDGKAASKSEGRVVGGLLESTMGRCRAVKTDAEVACILKANQVSGEAHKAMWRACRPGMFEYQLEAVFRQEGSFTTRIHTHPNDTIQLFPDHNPSGTAQLSRHAAS